MELIHLNVIEPIGVSETQWTADDSEALLSVSHNYRPTSVFAPDFAPVAEILREAPVLAVSRPDRGALDLLISTFVAAELSPARSQSLAEGILGARASEMAIIRKVMTELQYTFGRTSIPSYKGTREGLVRLENFKQGIMALAAPVEGSRIFILPSMLVDIAISVTSMEDSLVSSEPVDMLLMHYVGENPMGVTIPPFIDWSNRTVDMMVDFLNKRGGRYVSFPLEFEQVARAVHFLAGFGFADGKMIVGGPIECLNTLRRIGASHLITRELGTGFEVPVPEVLRLISTFVEATKNQLDLPESMYDGLTTRNLTGACYLMRYSATRDLVMRAYRDYLRVLPVPLVDNLRQRISVPPMDHGDVINKALIHPIRAQTIGHPDQDCLRSSVYGSHYSALAELSGVLHHAGCLMKPQNLLVVCNAALTKALGPSPGFAVKRHAQIEQRLPYLGEDYDTVVICRGEMGELFGIPSSLHDAPGKIEEVRKWVGKLMVHMPRVLAICGPFDGFDKHGTPDYLKDMVSEYDVVTMRPAMGVEPLFWTIGVRRAATSAHQVKVMMRAALRDLHICQIVSRSMAMAGQVCFPFKYTLHQPLKGVHPYLIMGSALFANQASSTTEMAQWLVMRTACYAHLADLRACRQASNHSF